jgi:signal transduction histidine kinase
MSVTHSRSDSVLAPVARRRSVGLAADVAFVVVVITLLFAMYRMHGYETVPYHVIFVSFAAVYGFRMWSLPVTIVVLVTIIVATGAVLVTRWAEGMMPVDELSEIVLMPLILGAMIWHARRRAAVERQLGELAELERERRLREHEFSRDTSHALRTPLTIARGHLELVREELVDPEMRADVDVAMQELDRITRMATRLLAIAELERPDTLQRRLVDVTALVRETHARWSVAVPRRWHLDATGALAAHIDEDVLRISLDAVLENAIRVTGVDDVVQMICRRRGTDLVIGVGDSGPGIPEDERAQVFQRFWRDRHRREGTGLGLSYVRAAAEAHGGKVLVGTSPAGGAFVGFAVPSAAVAPTDAADALTHESLGVR